MIVREHDALIVCRAEAAGTFMGRLLGLMGRIGIGESEGLFLHGSSAVHTCFMRFSLDLVFLDAEGRIVSLRSRVRPWRFAFGGRAARDTLELAGGRIDALGLRVGDRIVHQEDDAGAWSYRPDRGMVPLTARVDVGMRG